MRTSLSQKRARLPDALSYPLFLSLFISLVGLVVALIYLPKAQPELPLFYTLDSVVGPLANKWFLLILPGLATGLSLLNLSIVRLIKNSFSLLLVKLYALAHLLIITILIVAMLRIIYVTW